MKLTELDKDTLTEELESILTEITDFLGLEMEYDYEIEAYETAKGDEREIMKVRLKGDRDPLLIGYHGQTLDRIQHIVSMSLSSKFQQIVRVALNVNDYRDGREDYLTGLASRTAEQVIESGLEVELEPMKAPDRRIVHNALGNDPQIETQSTGEGRDRRIIVSLKQLN